jgi:Protein phosphatase 2C
MQDCTWHSVCSSIMGRSHELNLKPCQDFSQRFECNGIYGVALSDGAGSAQHAEIGAQIAVEWIIQNIPNRIKDFQSINEDQIQHWLKELQEYFCDYAIKNQTTIEDLSATILFVMVKNTEAFFFQLGDGCWLFQHEDLSWHCATWPESGEYINETVFITSLTTANQKIQWCVQQNVRAVVGFTDGVEHLFLNFTNRSPHKQVLEKIFSFIQQNPPMTAVQEATEQLLTSPFLDERTDDDKTLTLLWRELQ